MKLAAVKVHLETATTAAALETALAAWLAAGGERSFLEVRFAAAAGLYTALILYSD